MAPAGQQIRIAIALTALRHKPPQQSIDAYILDLQTAFPTGCPDLHRDRPPSPNPWRERVLALEKELAGLQAQYDREKLELLALRKSTGTAKVRSGRDPPKESDSSTRGKKAKANSKKTKTAVSAPQTRAPIPSPPPLAQIKLELTAVLRAGALADLPAASATNVSTSIEAFEIMADMLAENALSVALELVLSTTIRSLRAVGCTLDLVISRSSSGRASLQSNTGTGHSGSGLLAPDPASAMAALASSVHRIVSIVFPVLLAHHSTSVRIAAAKKTSAIARERAYKAQSAAAAAVDDILGHLYAFILAPAVRFFSVLSEDFVAACLMPELDARTNSPHARATSNPPRRQKNSAAIAAPLEPSLPRFPPDLRPAALALIDGTLSALEVSLPLTAPSLGSSATSSESASAKGSGGHGAAIPGTRHVKTLLALECVRELERLYLGQQQPACEPVGATNTDTGRASAESSVNVKLGRVRWNGDAAVYAGAPPALSTLRHDGRRIVGSGTDERIGPSLGLRDVSTRPGTGESGAVATRISASAGLSAGLKITSLGSEFLVMGAGGPQQNLGKIPIGADSGPGRGRCATAQGTGTGTTPGSASSAPGSGGKCISSGNEITDLVSDMNGIASAAAGAADSPGDLRGTRARMTTLARRDAVWYLCTVLHRLLPSCVAGPGLSSVTAGSMSSTPSSGQQSASGTTATPTTASSAGLGSGSGLVLDVGANTCDSGDATGAAVERAIYDGLVGLLCRTRPSTLPAFSMGLSLMHLSPRKCKRKRGARTRDATSSTDLDSDASRDDEEDDHDDEDEDDQDEYGRPRSRARRGSSPASNHEDSSPGLALRHASASTSPYVVASASVTGSAPSLPSPPDSQIGYRYEKVRAGSVRVQISRARSPVREIRDRRPHAHKQMEVHAEGVGTRTQSLFRARVDSRTRMGEVERGMLLAVLERAWLGV